jgi:hypothetical protein
MISPGGADQPWPLRPMDTSDLDPETGEAWGVDPDAADNCPEVT